MNNFELGLRFFTDVLGGISDIIGIVKSVVSLGKLPRSDQQDILKFYISMKNAIAETRDVIESKDGNYSRNNKLSSLWRAALLNAYADCLKNWPNFPSWLDSKASFWENPNQWLNEPDSMKLVPTLDHLDAELETLKGYLSL